MVPAACIFVSKSKTVTPPDLLLLALLLFTGIQLFFLIFIFSRLIFFKGKTYEAAAGSELPGVSVIICAWNELENLKELLPLLEEQDYPTYEILVIDDRSTDGTEEFLRDYCVRSAKVRTIRVNEEYDHITPKKYAVTIGQKHARYALSLMTDADCRPTGLNWISSMASRVGGRKEIVLGFSPYFKEKGLLNWLIRCETFNTVVQYFSFALYGLAYMGVGRNLLYRRQLFFDHRGFYGHSKIMGGDDDLFINQIATFRNTTINPDPASFMYSIPKKTWSDWFRQKRRHLGVGTLYKPHFKYLLGLIAGSHVFTWLMALANVVVALILKDMYLLCATGVIFGARWLLQWLGLGLVNRRLGSTLGWYTMPLMDFTMFLYYLIMGGYNMFVGKAVTRWR